jgi:hypothetical protein
MVSIAFAPSPHFFNKLFSRAAKAPRGLVTGHDF